MRKIIVSVYATLDGVMGPLDWTGHYHSPEHGAYARDLLFECDALIAGRETFEIFANTWENRTSADDGPGEEGFIDRINSMPKYVASRTLKEPLRWNGHLLKGDIAQAVAQLKQQPGQKIIMYGAGPVAYTLVQNGLVDEIQIWLYPVIAGDGLRLFNSASDLPYLQLLETTQFPSGVVIHTYQPEQKREQEPAQ